MTKEIPKTDHGFLLVGFLLSFISGCASTPLTDHLLQLPPANIPNTIELNDVTYFAQEAHQCGPAALAMVLHQYLPEITPDQLSPEVFVPQLEGSLQPEIVAATRRHGFIPYIIRPDLVELLQQVQHGYPVLVLQNLGLSWVTNWHYAVVIGFDLQTQSILLRSGPEQRHQVSLRTFERTWQRADHWAMVVLKPGDLPANPDEWRYFQAIVGFEQIKRWPELQRAYLAGIAKWPDSQDLHMGLGNLFYATHDLAAAREQYQQVLQHSPAYAPAHNNLAEVLVELNELSTALHHAEEAVRLGGVHSAIYLSTLQDIRARLARKMDKNNKSIP